MNKRKQKPKEATFDIMQIKTTERDMFEKQIIFDGSINKQAVQEMKKDFVEFDEDDQKVDVSKFASLIKAPTPIAPRPILHSYTENQGVMLNMKRKTAEGPTFENPLKRIKTD